MWVVARIHSFIVQKCTQKTKLHHFFIAVLFDSFLFYWGLLEGKSCPILSLPPSLSTSLILRPLLREYRETE